MIAMEARQDWKEFQNDWTPRATAASEAALNGVQAAHGVWSMWSRSFLDRASRCEAVESVLALGSVLAIRLRDENSGTLLTRPSQRIS
jgi:dethiobiotin synthetase/adenosylmethionine--8-amino-7-oxononanoate aminotransferase